MDWESFISIFEEKVERVVPPRAPERLDEEVELFDLSIQTTARKSTSTSLKSKVKGNNYPKEIKNKKRERKIKKEVAAK